MMKLLTITMTALSLVLSGCSWQSDQQQAKQTISQFYDTDARIQPSGALNLNELLAFREYVSVSLFELLKDVSELEEANFHRADNYVEPLIVGDPFTANPAGQTSYSIIHCAYEADKENRQICRVALSNHDKNGSQNRWEDQIVMTKDVRGWVIDNISYANSGPSFRNGNLHTLLLDILNSTDDPDHFADD